MPYEQPLLGLNGDHPRHHAGARRRRLRPFRFNGHGV
jgi:hypothetical protein